MAAIVVRSSVFRDTDQTNRVLSILNEQRATSRFCDVILKVRDEHIYAHSNVLAAASPYFGSFLGLGLDSPRAFCEKSPQVIEIQIDGADAGNGYGDAVRHVVEYMYTRSLELNSVIISQIAEIARIMQVHRVLDYCERFLKGENGVIPLDTKSPMLTDLGHSRRVRKAHAATETELLMFQKSSNLPLEKLQQEMVLSAQAVPANVPEENLIVVQDTPDQSSEVDPTQPESSTGNSQHFSCSEKGTQLDADSVSDSQVQDQPFQTVVQEDSPIILIKNEAGSITGTVAVPFINVPLLQTGNEGLTAVVKEEDPHEGPAPRGTDPMDSSSHLTFPAAQPAETTQLRTVRGRRRGRHGYRGRGRKRRVREVLSDSDPELIQEPEDDIDVLEGATAHKQSTGAAEGATASQLSRPKEETTSDLSSEPASSQDMPSASSSATNTTLSAASAFGEDVIEELPKKLNRTRGRKPITSVMASWTSPRRRAGIPRSVFRSDYVMHSLIRRSRHSGALQPSVLQGNEMTGDDEGNEAMEICDALSKSMGDTSAGLDSTIKFVCQTCDFTTVSFRQYRQHMKRHPETDTRSYTCTECNFHTTKARQLLQHRKKHLHEDLICSYCEIQLDSQENFEKHLQRHSHSLPYFCHACDMRFKTRTQLTTHQPKHRTEKPFICQICGNGFKWKHALKSHMVTHSATKDHLCDICGFATAHKSQLKAHRLIHTGDTFKCPEPSCSFEATKRQNLKYHMVTHTQVKAHQCEVCGQAFSLIKNMRRHMLLHGETRPFHCSVCSYSSTRYDKLKEHKLKQHAIGQPPGASAKVKYTTVHLPITLPDDGTLLRQGMESLHMEPITIAQDGNNITIRSDVTLTDEALQTIAQIAASSQDNPQGHPHEAQINIATSEGIPIIARVQFTSATDPDTEVINYVTHVQE
ncbi:uncharacterized protein [Littorina saxatilis]|uniref:uncharacterized protein n=1 Tax=Littorina saxatilis TaxID=31220 RepID=UPI0038B4BDCE